MSARLTVLGGSSAGVGTGQGCSGYYLDLDGTRLVLDLGPDTLLELRKHTDFRTLDAVVISHLHLDHILDLFALRFALCYNPHRPANRTPLWLPPGGKALLDGVAKLFAGPGELETYFSQHFDINEYDPGKPLNLGSATVTFAPTVHYVPCWAIRVSGGDAGDLLYTADTGPAAPLAAFGHGAAVLVAEATLLEPGPEPRETRGHMTAGEAAELGQDIGVTTLVLTHIWEELGQERAVASAASIYRGRLARAHPGLTISW